MIEQSAPPEDLCLDQAELNFEPMLTQELLLTPEIQRRAEVLADLKPRNESTGTLPAMDIQILPPCLEVEGIRRKETRRIWLLMVTLAVVTLVQFVLYLGLRNRAPARIYPEAPSLYLVQP